MEIETSCAHCDEAIVLAVDGELNFEVKKGGPDPLVFEPEVDWSEFNAPTIIDGY